MAVIFSVGFVIAVCVLFRTDPGQGVDDDCAEMSTFYSDKLSSPRSDSSASSRAAELERRRLSASKIAVSILKTDQTDPGQPRPKPARVKGVQFREKLSIVELRNTTTDFTSENRMSENPMLGPDEGGAGGNRRRQSSLGASS